MKKFVLNRASNFVLLLVLAYLLWMAFYALAYSMSAFTSTAFLRCGILMALSLGCLFALRLRPEIKARLSLLLASILLSLFLVEGVLCLWGYFQSSEVQRRIIAHKSGIDYDCRSKHEVVVSLRKTGKPTVPAFAPNYFFGSQYILYIDDKPAIPCGGVANILTVAGNECGSHLIYESDEHGFHNPKGLYTTDRMEVVLVGDSFVHGLCVRSDENMAAHLRAKYGSCVKFGL